MAERIPIAFAAGLASIVFPCVLPLVPGYVSAVTAVEASRLGEPGSARRIALRSLPFFAGFTAVFVALGAGAAALAEVIGPQTQLQVAGFVLVVFGLAFMGLLPIPQGLVGARLLARARGSSALLGAAFAVCAAPCIGGVLAGILVLAGDAGTIARGSILLFFYSVGIAVAFLLVGIAFARTMSVFRWLRDRWVVVQAVSGAALVALGLLLFFDRYWWLQVGFNRALSAIGLDDF
ncbi:MAG: cytochrome c biogenesis protein CcdA [Gaiellaceae bacterium]